MHLPMSSVSDSRTHLSPAASQRYHVLRSVPHRSERGPVFQLAEKTDSKPVQCGFESHPGYAFPQVRASDRRSPGVFLVLIAGMSNHRRSCAARLNRSPSSQGDLGHVPLRHAFGFSGIPVDVRDHLGGGVPRSPHRAGGSAGSSIGCDDEVLRSPNPLPTDCFGAFPEERNTGGATVLQCRPPLTRLRRRMHWSLTGHRQPPVELWSSAPRKPRTTVGPHSCPVSQVLVSGGSPWSLKQSRSSPLFL